MRRVLRFARRLILLCLFFVGIVTLIVWLAISLLPAQPYPDDMPGFSMPPHHVQLYRMGRYKQFIIPLTKRESYFTSVHFFRGDYLRMWLGMVLIRAHVPADPDRNYREFELGIPGFMLTVSADRPGTMPERRLWIVVRLPILFIVLSMLSLPMIAVIRGPIRRWRRVKRGLCVGCGYDLRGNVGGVCSECGRQLEQTKMEQGIG